MTAYARVLSVEYHEVLPMSREEAERLLRSGNESAMIRALLSSAYHDPDWRWVQGRCISCLDDAPLNVRRMATTCLGHIARIHRTLDTETVLLKLTELKTDPSISGWVEDALEDINIFVRPN